jgi:hypothetical protein
MPGTLSSKRSILVTRPDYDDATSYSFYYAGLVASEAEDRGIAVLDLKRPRLTKENLEAILQEKQPGFVFFNAHGNERTIYGDKLGESEEVLIEEGKNHGLLDSRLVYARTCWAAASLGRACKGGCFIGYNIPFSFWMDSRWSAKPSNDNTARLFFEPSNIIASSLLKGNTSGESMNKSKAMTIKTILRLLKEREEPGAMASVRLLWSNMQGTEILGDSQMRFE